MPKKTTILIAILAVITGVLIFLAVRSDQTQDLINRTVLNREIQPSPVEIQPFATLSFSTPVLDLSEGQATGSVEILIDSANLPVSTAQVELSYNSRLLTNMKIEQPSSQELFFGNDQSILISSIDPAQGRISYAVGIPVQGSEKTGTGTLVKLSFIANRSLGIESTQITFLPKSTVTNLSTRGSVLKNSIPLTVVLTK